MGRRLKVLRKQTIILLWTKDNYPSRSSFQMDRLLLFVAIRIVSIGKLGLIMVFYRANQQEEQRAIMCVQFN